MRVDVLLGQPLRQPLRLLVPVLRQIRVGVPVHQRKGFVHVRGLRLAVPDQQDVGRSRRRPEPGLPVGGRAGVRLRLRPAGRRLAGTGSLAAGAPYGDWAGWDSRSGITTSAG